MGWASSGSSSEAAGGRATTAALGGALLRVIVVVGVDIVPVWGAVLGWTSQAAFAGELLDDGRRALRGRVWGSLGEGSLLINILRGRGNIVVGVLLDSSVVL